MQRSTLLVHFLVAVAASSAHAAVKGPWVTTNRTIDCSSYQSIARDLFKPGMSDEDKAIAMYRFFRQRVYHYQNLPESREPLKTVNIFGNTLCGSQATCMKGLLESAGLKTRVVSHPGHTFYEVWYGDKWHGFDTMTNFYVFTRGKNRTVASFADLRKDPSLIQTAVKEGRACPSLCPCGDRALNFAKPVQVLNYKPSMSKWNVKDYQLRLGEEIVRSWQPHGKPLPGSHQSQDPGPLHTCGTRDRRAEPFLFKFWEPYGIARLGPSTTVSYRHYFNGWFNYSPNLSDRKSVLDGGGKLDGIKVTPKGLVGPGTYTFHVKSPFHITGADLDLDTAVGNKNGALVVAINPSASRFQNVFRKDVTGRKQHRISLDNTVVRPRRGHYEYVVRIELTGGAMLHRMHLRTWFQHNAMAAPHLMPGKNRVTVTVDNEKALNAAPLTLIYRYRDAPKWTGAVITIEKRVPKNADTFQVSLAETKKLPQMRDVTLRYGTLAWTRSTKTKATKRVIADFALAATVSNWSADKPLRISHDGKGMLIECPTKAVYPQASLSKLREDWSGYTAIIIELENLAKNPQRVVFRARSNESNDQRTDVERRIDSGKTIWRIPTRSLRKTRLNAVTKIYFMAYQVPQTGCRLRLRRIYLVGDDSQ